ncbi:MAG: tetratricopeptide repeat protein [Pseudomonadota bacterium]
MSVSKFFRQTVLTASLLGVGFSLPAAAQERIPELLDQLKQAEPDAAKRLTREIRLEWSQSGSVAVNMLLERGRDALEEKDYTTAVGHLTAVTDHAPDFAEGFHTRARAYAAMKLYGPAIADLGRTLQLNPVHFQAFYGLGVLFAEFGDVRRAEDAFTRALDLHPNFEEAQEALKRLERQGIGRTL